MYSMKECTDLSEALVTNSCAFSVIVFTGQMISLLNADIKKCDINFCDI